VSPSLPSGLELNVNTGVIEGQPQGVSEGTYAVVASNEGGDFKTTIQIIVRDTKPGTLAYEDVVLMERVNQFEDVEPQVCNCHGSTFSVDELSRLEWSVIPVPTSLHFDTRTGVFSGIPAMADAGYYTVSVQNTGGRCTGTLRIDVHAYEVELAPLKDARTTPALLDVRKHCLEMVDSMTEQVDVSSSNNLWCPSPQKSPPPTDPSSPSCRFKRETTGSISLATGSSTVSQASTFKWGLG